MEKKLTSQPDYANILIVDDVATNLQILGEILQSSGYKVRPVLNGSVALQVAENEKPDLVLLDIMMPDMNGFEVCRRFKENERLSDVPIIFISALSDSKDIVNAFNAGGVDYITKPFRAEEVKARVAAHIKIYKLQNELRDQKTELANLNVTKDKFFSIIAHDLRGPFSGFLGLTQIMAEQLETLTFNELQNFLSGINKSANNLDKLLNNLLEWARLQQGAVSFEPESMHLLPVVSITIQPVMDLAIKKGIEINIHISENIMVFADENMLASTIRNLTSNAVKFTPAGGNVNLSAETLADGALKFSVKDSGIGMNAEMVENIFKLDVSTSQRGTDNEQGTGLGLILCKEFIEKHGGELHVESKDGAGSTFYFTLPGNTQPPEIEVTEKIDPVNNSGKQVKALKVLIAEDDETSHMLISIYVKPFSKEILKTTKGTEAIEICRQNPDIDMILMDIMMPEMGGYEATRQIRQFNKKVVIIAQTAFGMTGDREKAIAAGCNDYISKPIKKNELTGLIQKYFGK